jgi:hypothetical protein
VKASAPSEAEVTPGAVFVEEAVEGAGRVDAGAGVGVDEVAAGGEAPVAGAPLGGAAPGSVVVVVVVAGATVTTKKSATLFPFTCPGDESPTKV